MENNQNTNKLKKQQKQILFLLYKFRFLTINQLQKYFNHKDPHRVKEWLKDLREVARAMNNWGLGQNFKGKKYSFRQQSVNRLFRSKFYMGLLTSRRYPEEIRGQHTPMVTSEQFYAYA